MAHERTRRAPVIRFLPGHLRVGIAVAGMLGAWLLVLAGLAGTVGLVSRLGAATMLPVLMMCGGTVPAVWATRQVVEFQRVRTKVPAPMLGRRRYGDLTAIADDGCRALRPVGMTVSDVVARTDALLDPLTALPGVRIFEGVRLPGSSRPVVSHAVSAGRLLVFVESVAWPPGRYRMDATGRLRCDGQYIGQTVRALSLARHACQALLPWGHRVHAVIVVHRAADGDYVLPAGTKELRWTLAENLPGDLRALLAPHLSTVSRHTIAALTEGPAHRRRAAWTGPR